MIIFCLFRTNESFFNSNNKPLVTILGVAVVSPFMSDLIFFVYFLSSYSSESYAPTHRHTYTSTRTTGRVCVCVCVLYSRFIRTDVERACIKNNLNSFATYSDV